jgi:Tol biopolymer transport system component
MQYFIKPIFVLTGICILPLFIWGQTSPSLLQNIVDSTAKAIPFAPNVISTCYDEDATSFSPDGKTVYFTMGSPYSTVCFSKNFNGKWTRPKVASFSGRWNDMDAFISPDGGKIFFSSYRPVPGSAPDAVNQYADLWYADNLGDDTWGEPHHLDAPINTGYGNDYAPSISADGTLYWCSPNRDGNRGMQGYYARWLGEHFDEPKLLSIRGVAHIQDPFIAPNGKYLVFLNGRDLFVSMRQQESWSTAVKIGPPVSSLGDYIGAPYVSRDGKTLYFTSARRKGFYKRDPDGPPLTYDELVKENENIFNGTGKILTVPVNLPDGN